MEIKIVLSQSISRTHSEIYLVHAKEGVFTLTTETVDRDDESLIVSQYREEGYQSPQCFMGGKFSAKYGEEEKEWAKSQGYFIRDDQTEWMAPWDAGLPCGSSRKGFGSLDGRKTFLPHPMKRIELQGKGDASWRWASRGGD